MRQKRIARNTTFDHKNDDGMKNVTESSRKRDVNVQLRSKNSLKMRSSFMINKENKCNNEPFFRTKSCN